ncbi:hypothetical protein HYPBUDRAFT_202777 [Hyphopichia burtonii NRRL Y-1933]|uniref:Uncharacterized protein n=1 Tax=Hyphopichia burtonii NRRL Y-1933 TaxID=984485 RepID=A0A1E4RLL9_9ASCO|nr:hypothetical protein HYPBUDRAFT_202777 [Hyphopichia burtonii NRRL Y-1933]ODV68157.1 hypothetical protein HYPBUDRAFT_202777 [Hyphopichia burtonii NRRL Y-1933]
MSDAFQSSPGLKGEAGYFTFPKRRLQDFILPKPVNFKAKWSSSRAKFTSKHEWIKTIFRGVTPNQAKDSRGLGTDSPMVSDTTTLVRIASCNVSSMSSSQSYTDFQVPMKNNLSTGATIARKKSFLTNIRQKIYGEQNKEIEADEPKILTSTKEETQKVQNSTNTVFDGIILNDPSLLKCERDPNNTLLEMSSALYESHYDHSCALPELPKELPENQHKKWERSQKLRRAASRSQSKLLLVSSKSLENINSRRKVSELTTSANETKALSTRLNPVDLIPKTSRDLLKATTQVSDIKSSGVAVTNAPTMSGIYKINEATPNTRKRHKPRLRLLSESSDPKIMASLDFSYLEKMRKKLNMLTHRPYQN